MLDKSLAVLAGRQHGVLSRAQVLATGGDDDFIAWRLRTEAWARVAPGVYGLPGWPPTWKRFLWIAHLAVGPGSVVSHQAAAALHGFYTFKPGPVVLTVVHGDHERPGPWTVRQSTDLRPTDITTADGLAVTTPARTLFDLSAVLSRPRYERVLDDAHVSRCCRIEDVEALYRALRRPGKRGMKMLGQVIECRGSGYVPTASELERRLVKLLRRGGLPDPSRQYPLPWRVGAEGRVDLAYPEHRVVIEGDGRRWHSRMDQMAADRRRDREAVRHGWRPYRFVWEEITGQPEMVCQAVRDALSSFPST